MCGINGLFSLSESTISAGEGLIQRMNHAIRHRGPDDRGEWNDPARRIFLGHQRLSIIDTSPSGHQPMKGIQGNVIVFNGEIFNYKKIKQKIQPFSFQSQSDTEVLLHLYESIGHCCLEKLQGMFAFAIWDSNKKELFLARDRIGIKPLYYSTVNGIFAFSSEIKALLQLPWIKAEIDESALYHFLTFNKLSPPQTMFKNIFKFHPGYKMMVGYNGIKLYEKYWEVSYDNLDEYSLQVLQERVTLDLDRAVSDWTISDVPVGAFLSGGVDSSAIVALMSQHTTKPIKTYSIGFKDAPAYDELDHARKIARQFNTDHYERMVAADDIIEFLPRIVEIFDEPLADATSIPIYFLSQMAREKGTTVVMTGDGGDELFCGYRRWVQFVKLYPYYRYYMNLPGIVTKSIAQLFGLFNDHSPKYEILSRAAKKQDFFWGGAGGFKESIKAGFFSSNFRKRVAEEDSYSLIANSKKLFESIPVIGRKMTDVDWLCFMGIKETIPNFYLYRTDRMGMANGVEIRVPFLDHHFVKFALSIPGRFKVMKSEPKYILKKSLENLLPHEVLYRKKQGFCVPLHEWMGEYFLDFIEKKKSIFCRNFDYFDEHALDKLIEQSKKNRKDNVFMLWNLYFLFSWFEKWIK